MKDKVKELRWVPASELRANPKNWRRHPASQKAALHGTVDQIGFTTPLQVRELSDGSLELIDGHLRLEEFGGETLPVVVVDLTEAEAAVALLTHDPMAMMAHADTDQLLELLRDNPFESQAVADMLEALVNGERFPMPDLTQPTGSDAEDPGPQIDRAEELREKWQTERGQVWEVGRHRLMCGDAAAGDLDVLMDVTAVMVWADPPYGVDYGHNNNPRWGKHDRIVNDDLPEDELASFWAAVFIAVANHATGDLYIAAPPGPLLRLMDNTLEQTPWERHQWLVWVKNSLVLGRSNYHYRHEQIWYGWLRKGKSSWAAGRNQDSVFDIPRPSRSVEHPTMKPVELVSRMVENSSELGEVVLDPFLGSGTTMVAAEQLGRICYGMEIEPKYVAVTLERMAGMGLEPHLLAL